MLNPAERRGTPKESVRGRKDLRDVVGEFPTLKFDSE